MLEKEFNFWIEKWTYFDEDGYVFGYPSMIDIDVAIKNEKVILIEFSSHVRASDVSIFQKKCELYEKVTGRKAARKMIVTPFAEEKAKETCKHYKIELYTKV